MAKFFVGSDRCGHAYHLLTQCDSPLAYRLPAVLRSPDGELLTPGRLVATQPTCVWVEDVIAAWSMLPGRTNDELQAAKSFCEAFIQELCESSLDL